MKEAPAPSANPDTIDLQVKDLVARMTGISDAHSIDTSKSVIELMDSLKILEFREILERIFRVFISDDEWLGFRSIDQLMGFINSKQAPLRTSPSSAARQHETMQTRMSSSGSRGWSLTPSGILYDEMEIGMPFTGLNNLCEGPLLQRVGDLRWNQLSALCGVPSKELADSDGQRLYSTFFYVEIAFPEDRPMASYGENDRIKFLCTMKRFGYSMLDGVTYLMMPGDSSETSAPPFGGIEGAVAAGIPAVRLSNIFVMQFAGAEWLKKSRPANPGFERIPESALAPDSYTAVKQAEKDGYFAPPGKTYIPMTRGPVKIEYRLVPDRDLNGAGLVYFANYPVFLDIGERPVLGSAEFPLSEDLINRRTIVRRKSAYLNNASARDVLDIEVEPWIENPFLTGHPSPEMAPIRLFINCRMYRRSDHRLMMVSTAEKIIFSRPMEEVPFFSRLSGA
ncbi:MAG: hypothetical protein LAO31_11005 [Acidobacteriia bacterium]|nr:hypothetical protein [Terriglobia bacterium]